MDWIIFVAGVVAGLIFNFVFGTLLQIFFPGLYKMAMERVGAGTKESWVCPHCNGPCVKQ